MKIRLTLNQTFNVVLILLILGTLRYQGYTIEMDFTMTDMRSPDSLVVDTLPLPEDTIVTASIITPSPIVPKAKPKDIPKPAEKAVLKPAAERTPSQIDKVLAHIEKVSPKRFKYVDKYYEIAIGEARQYGVPVSITLAQGILESDSGNSTVCKQNMNHFGVKYYGLDYIPKSLHKSIAGFSYAHDDCRKEHFWSGTKKEGYFTVRSKNGRYELCKSPDKYVKYKSHWASFRHHSYVVTKRRYTKYNPKKYNDWAWAFRYDRGGYATDKKYHEKLINIIQSLHLYKLDNL